MANEMRDRNFKIADIVRRLRDEYENKTQDFNRTVLAKVGEAIKRHGKSFRQQREDAAPVDGDYWEDDFAPLRGGGGAAPAGDVHSVHSAAAKSWGGGFQTPNLGGGNFYGQTGAAGGDTF